MNTSSIQINLSVIFVEKSAADELLGRNVVRIFRHLDQLDARKLTHEDQLFIAQFKRYTMNDPSIP